MEPAGAPSSDIAKWQNSYLLPKKPLLVLLHSRPRAAGWSRGSVGEGVSDAEREEGKASEDGEGEEEEGRSQEAGPGAFGDAGWCNRSLAELDLRGNATFLMRERGTGGGAHPRGGTRTLLGGCATWGASLQPVLFFIWL